MGDFINELHELRRALHRHAEPSHKENQTAKLVTEYLARYSPDHIHRDLGGHGVAAVYESGAEGPTVLVRCELDALPIPETVSLDYASETTGVSHKCGHDGHMVMVAALARLLHESRTERGRVVLLFQPAEETGEGAALVVNDPGFAAIRPDYAFALHNLPGFPEGSIILRDGAFASASKGLIVHLRGATSHAAEPQLGRSPALAVAELINAFSAAPQFFTALHEAAKVTVIHAILGERAFGTSPGSAEVMATLRSHSQEVMDNLADRCTGLAKKVAAAYGLEESVEWVEEFPLTANDPECVDLLAGLAGELGLSIERPSQPFAWSEDFGHFTAACKGAMFGLGSGRDHAVLHHPTYDFPEQLIPVGVSMFTGAIRKILGGMKAGIDDL